MRNINVSNFQPRTHFFQVIALCKAERVFCAFVTLGQPDEVSHFPKHRKDCWRTTPICRSPLKQKIAKLLMQVHVYMSTVVMKDWAFGFQVQPTIAVSRTRWPSQIIYYVTTNGKASSLTLLRPFPPIPHFINTQTPYPTIQWMRFISVKCCWMACLLVPMAYGAHEYVEHRHKERAWLWRKTLPMLRLCL